MIMESEMCKLYLPDQAGWYGSNTVGTKYQSRVDCTSASYLGGYTCKYYTRAWLS